MLEQSGHGSLEKYRRVVNENKKLRQQTASRTSSHAVATYEQFKKSLSHFYPDRTVESDGIDTQPLIW